MLKAHRAQKTKLHACYSNENAHPWARPIYAISCMHLLHPTTQYPDPISRWDNPLIGDVRKEVNDHIVKQAHPILQDTRPRCFLLLIILLILPRTSPIAPRLQMAAGHASHSDGISTMDPSQDCTLHQTFLRLWSINAPTLTKLWKKWFGFNAPNLACHLWDRRSHRVDIPQKCAKLIPNSQTLQAAKQKWLPAVALSPPRLHESCL